MVITCPSCAARYRLNPDKVQGRGAKITCPKCSHVFVVFTDQDGEAAAKPPAPPKIRTPPRPAAPPTTETDKRSATHTGAFRAVGIAPADDSLKRESKSKVRVVAPGPRSTRRVRALSTPASAAPRGPSSGSQPRVATADMEIGSASELDFRSVGIKTWKVKVAIGLIYDFSDISTLQKYLADKKVTPDDLISHNNSDWTRIGDIEDLDAHFVETWRVARAAIDSGEAPAPKKKKKEEPADGASAAAAGTSTDSFRIDTNRGRSTGNYPAPASPRRRAPEPEEEEGNNKKALMVLAAVVVLGGLAWTFFQPDDAPLAADPTAPVAVEDLGPSDAELKQIQENIQNELEAQRERLKQEVGADPTEVAGEDDAPRELVAVPPSERSDPTPIQQPVQQPTIPKYTPPTPQKAPVAARQDPPKSSSGTLTVGGSKGNPGAVYLGAGNKKLTSGDYAGAVKMFKLAIGKDPKCGSCYAGLAKAEKALGNASAAAAAEQKAQDLKSPQSMASP